MRSQPITLAALAVASVALGSAARADVLRPGSLLIIPEIDNRYGIANAVTVTNTHENPDAGSVWLEYVYINKDDCGEFNRVEYFTGNDTLTILTRLHSPEYEQGYLYIFAKDSQWGDPIKHDWLIAQNLVIDGMSEYQYSTNAFVFRSGDADLIAANDGKTDLDHDGLRDLNGLEYEEVPDQILIPRFLGQDYYRKRLSELVLIALTGGTKFTTTLDFLIYNDNEQAFSAQYTFFCWAKKKLLDISNAFGNDFLLEYSDHAYDEIQGAPYLKSGWIRIDGNWARSNFFEFEDPAFLAVLVERVGPFGASDLPFGVGHQANGDLLPYKLQGDTDDQP